MFYIKKVSIQTDKKAGIAKELHELKKCIKTWTDLRKDDMGEKNNPLIQLLEFAFFTMVYAV